MWPRSYPPQVRRAVYPGAHHEPQRRAFLGTAQELRLFYRQGSNPNPILLENHDMAFLQGQLNHGPVGQEQVDFSPMNRVISGGAQTSSDPRR